MAIGKTKNNKHKHAFSPFPLVGAKVFTNNQILHDMKKNLNKYVWYTILALMLIGFAVLSVGFLLNSYSAFAIGIFFLCFSPWFAVALILSDK